MKKILIATRNRAKGEEIKQILGHDFEIETLFDHPDIAVRPETGTTFKMNALAKARYISMQTRTATIADDSGLEVDALALRPGIFSARFAGPNATDEENTRKLLHDLEHLTAPASRQARFRCIIAYVEQGKGEVTFEGNLKGAIAFEPKGENGFGYDPVFLLPERGKTLAELTLEEKNAISHRAEALKRLKKWLEHGFSEE